MARIHGSHGQVQADADGGSNLVVIASLNAWTLNMATDKVPVTAFGDTNKVYVQGLPDLQGTIAGFYDNTDLTIFDIAMGTVAAKLRLIPNSLAPTHYWEGKAFLDASVNVTADGAVTTSGSFVASDSWIRNP